MADPGFSCATCPSFSSVDEKMGICRRYPPGVHIVPGVIDGKLRPVNLWPGVAKSDYCFEHPSAWTSVSLPPTDPRLVAEAQGEA